MSRSRTRTWTGSIHVNERKIPNYDAMKDPYCVFTKSALFNDHARQFSRRSRLENKRQKFERLGRSKKMQERTRKVKKSRTAKKRFVSWGVIFLRYQCDVCCWFCKLVRGIFFGVNVMCVC